VNDQPPAALDLREIEVRAGGRTILDVARLTVAPGERFALAGPNGAGKSTLLHVAGALRRPDHGEVWIGGERATPRAARRLRSRVGLVFQAPLLFDASVLANAASGLRFRGVGRAEAERTARLWLERFGVGALADRRPRGLSGGEAQRVSLARAFAMNPSLILLDEPFAALDAATRQALAPALLAELRSTGAAAVFVTHDLAEALALGDRLGILLGGRLVQTGAPADVLARPATVAAARFLGVEHLLPARIGARRGDLVEAEVAGADGPVRIVAAAVKDAMPGRAATLALRAASPTLLPDHAMPPPGWNVVPGRVVDVAPTSWGWRVTLIGRLTLEAHLAGGAPPAVGDQLQAAFPPTAAHLILTDATDHAAACAEAGPV
jgi:ABC-type sulfate/molybdate transport systems ATPase subunit